MAPPKNNRTRIISNLEWARFSTGTFFCQNINKTNFTNSQRRGLNFEKKVGKEVEKKCVEMCEEILIGPWIEFKDKNGLGIAQPDIVLVGKKRVIVLECKLTFTDSAWAQMNKLYIPLLRKMYPSVKNFAGVQVCKRLTHKPKQLEINHIEDSLSLRRGNAFLHLPFL